MEGANGWSRLVPKALVLGTRLMNGGIKANMYMSLYVCMDKNVKKIAALQWVSN